MDLTVEAFNNRSCEILQGVKDLESIYQKLLIKKSKFPASKQINFIYLQTLKV